MTTQVSEYVVVYDPAGGFTTGAGWFESPAGAYTPGDSTDPDVTGRANSGFPSRYQKGAHVPTGTTSFRFRAAGLDFDSTSYEWRVIAGERAQYEGADSLRIEIWAEDGTVVHDDQAGPRTTPSPAR